MAKEKRWHHASTGAVQERILDAALQAFQERGFSETTMADIVAAADTSIGSIYHHFGGKEELFAACYYRLRTSLREGIGMNPEEPLPPSADWEADYLRLIWKHRDTCVVFLGMDTPPGFEPGLKVAEYYRSLGEYNSRILAAMLLEAMRIITEVDARQADEVIDSTVKLLNVVRAVGF